MEKKIDGFEDYTVSEAGVVTNIRTGHIKKPTSNHYGKGYLYVDLYESGRRGRFYVHRLVANAFISNPQNKPYINHIDGNPHNNSVENLEWCTPLENVEHASKVLGAMKQYQIACKKKEKAVWQIDYKTGEKIKMFLSVRKAERETGINSSYISQICNGKFKQCFGYSWCFVETDEKEGKE